jgi:2-polyprenyl-3-methyl-5-hydroxy-6-metoxy-1,4-benzoquinol methylase
MSDSDRIKWDARHAVAPDHDDGPAEVLDAYSHLLPRAGRALDIACGRGANALFLAQRGLETVAWDISAVAIEALKVRARRLNLAIEAEQRDVVEKPPPASSFDVIVVSRFLDRSLIPALIAALQPAGLVFYQTFLRDAATTEGPRNPEYRLGSNELLTLFAPLRVLAYHEGGRGGDLSQGRGNEAMLVAQNRADR